MVKVGGQVDRSSIAPGIFGDDFDPGAITRLIGCEPTQAHRRGELGDRGMPPWPHGAWLLKLEVEAPSGPDELVPMLEKRLPSHAGFWSQLRGPFTNRVIFGLHMDDWNRGFDLTARSMRYLSELAVDIGFDIYAEPETADG